MEEKIDLRIAKTKDAIKAAFIQLLQEKSFHAITVQNISDTARINKKTFYAHYQDKYDLLEQLVDKFVEGFQQYADLRQTPLSSVSSYHDMATNIYKAYQKQSELILALLDIQTETINLRKHLLNILRKNYLAANASRDCTQFDMEFQSYLFAHINLCVLEYHLRTGKASDGRKIYREIKNIADFLSTPPHEWEKSSQSFSLPAADPHDFN